MAQEAGLVEDTAEVGVGVTAATEEDPRQVEVGVVAGVTMVTEILEAVVVVCHAVAAEVVSAAAGEETVPLVVGGAETWMDHPGEGGTVMAVLQ